MAGYALRESVRRRVFSVVLILTGGFLALYWFGVDQIYGATSSFDDPGAGPIDQRVLVAATLLGLAMFATLFLGAVLAVFLTVGAVRGDAERGLLQPLVVRPLGRSALLAGRFVAAAGVCFLYAVLVYTAAVLLTGAVTGWWPDRVVVPAVELGGAIIVLAALSLLGSVFLATTANGIAVFMLLGAGLVAGLLGQIAAALASERLETVATAAAWALPFEALYQDALHGITAETFGFTRLALSLGPFGGAQAAGLVLAPWVLGYFVLVAGLALAGFARRDL